MSKKRQKRILLRERSGSIRKRKAWIGRTAMQVCLSQGWGQGKIGAVSRTYSCIRGRGGIRNESAGKKGNKTVIRHEEETALGKE